MKDYSKPLNAMVRRWHELDEELKKLKTLAMATIREQRKVPGENNAKFVKYCTDLFVHNGVPCTPQQYETMRKRLKLLEYLEAGGVDNWEGYHEATREYYADEDADEISLEDYNRTIKAKETY